MARPEDRTEDAALWRRWRSAAPGAAAPESPDPLVLAAYIENRATASEVDSVEEWLADQPALAEDIVVARRLSQAPLPAPPPTLVARASALVQAGDAQVLAFRRPTPRWRTAIAWSGMAASVLVTGLIGFTLGTDAYLNLAGGAPPTLSQELLDPPTGLFNTLDEDSSI